MADNINLEWDNTITEEELLTSTLNQENIWIEETLNKMEKCKKESSDKVDQACGLTKRYCNGMLFEEMRANAERWEKACDNLRQLYIENKVAELMNAKDWVDEVYRESRCAEDKLHTFMELMSMSTELRQMIVHQYVKAFQNILPLESTNLARSITLINDNTNYVLGHFNVEECLTKIVEHTKNVIADKNDIFHTDIDYVIISYFEDNFNSFQ